jgi:hypothetical protein
MTPLTPTEDIRAARHRLAAKFDNDLDRIVADLRRQESESNAEFVTLPGRSPRRTANHAMHQSGEAERSDLADFPSPPGDR